jgi:hypothetical protein
MTSNLISRIRYYALVALTFITMAAPSFASSALAIQTKDVDAPGRKPYQTAVIAIVAPDNADTFVPVTTVSGNQRLVIQRVSGYCYNLNSIGLRSDILGQETKGYEFLERKFVSNDSAATSTEFYVNPGETLGFDAINFTGQTGSCYMALSGYFVNLP